MSSSVVPARYGGGSGFAVVIEPSWHMVHIGLNTGSALVNHAVCASCCAGVRPATWSLSSIEPVHPASTTIKLATRRTTHTSLQQSRAR